MFMTVCHLWRVMISFVGDLSSVQSACDQRGANGQDIGGYQDRGTPDSEQLCKCWESNPFEAVNVQDGGVHGHFR